MSPKITEPRPLQYSICVSGAASGPTIKASWDEASSVGRAIAKAGHVLTTGATVGLPYYAAKGAKEAGGTSIGFSPASSIREHLKKYRLPYEYFDFINFTGMNYVGRDLYLVQSSDAVITIGGRFGSLHEFTSALEAGRPCGVLLGSGGTADMIPSLVDALDQRFAKMIVYDRDPDTLVKKIVKVLDKELKDVHENLRSHDNAWFLRQPEPPRSG